MRQPVAILLVALILTVAISLAQPITVKSPVEGYPPAANTYVVTFQAATRSGIQAQLESWLRDPRNRTKRVVGPVQVTLDTANYETFGGRGVEPTFISAVTYVSP